MFGVWLLLFKEEQMIDRIINEELFPSGSSLITNFDRSDRHIYQKAIELSGHSELYIADDAIDIFGNRLTYLLALRTNECKDLSDFWDIFEQIQKGEIHK
jgi:hypothetical protein